VRIVGAGDRQALRSEGGRRARAAKRAAADRDPGQFLALPYSVLSSPGWMQVSNAAKVMLLAILQTAPNGALVACRSALVSRGYVGGGSHVRHLNELLDAGLLVCTRQGSRPSKASWFGATWLGLSGEVVGMDIDPRSWSAFRGLYMNPPVPKTLRAAPPGDGFSRYVSSQDIGKGSRSDPSGSSQDIGGVPSMSSQDPLGGSPMSAAVRQESFLVVASDPGVAP
jgi:hypothetical protein